MEEGEGEGEGGRRHFTLKGILKKEKEERQTKRRKRKAAEEVGLASGVAKGGSTLVAPISRAIPTCIIAPCLVMSPVIIMENSVRVLSMCVLEQTAKFALAKSTK